jgi:mannose-6-phosphate isomerase
MAAPPNPSIPLADPQAPLRAFRDWMIERALPFWATAGFDQSRDCFHERLFPDGTPDADAPRRTMVQARQIYVFTQAAALGWYPHGLSLAQRALASLRARALGPDGAPGFVHSVTAEGGIADATRDAYDHAFVLLALATLSRGQSDATLRDLIDATLAFVDAHLTAPDGTLFESVPRRLPRRQNPHMHFYEALLALQDADAHPSAAARAAAHRAHLDARFLDAKSGTLGEFFDDDWKTLADDDISEPGHHAEWSHLLHAQARIGGKDVEPLAAHLLDMATRGADPVTGFVFDGVSRAHAPRVRSRRVWPQTELAKAWLAAHERGHPGADARAARLLQCVMRDYLAVPCAGGYHDKRDENGAPVGSTMPASTLYHLFSAALEAHRQLERSA